MRRLPHVRLLLALTPVLVLLSLGWASAAPSMPGSTAPISAKIVIAHRSASGYLPEHTLPAVAMAYALGADYIEQDVVLTRDGVPIVVHDIYLEATTDVRQVFPNRGRLDGKYYPCDFTLAEVKSLRACERIDLKTNAPAFSGRFPLGASKFEVPTLAEEIELIQGLNVSTGRNVGIYPEIKGSGFHHQQGFDIEQIVLDVLAKYGYISPESKVFIQSFEPACLKRLRAMGCTLPLIQLISGSAEFNALVTPAGLDDIATYANGIGPVTTRIEDSKGRPVDNYSLVSGAHQRGLAVHPYTFRKDSMPSCFSSFEEMLRHFYFDIGVDGLFTDFTDIAVRVLKEAGR
ncbi:MAG: glycerophosphodiester phosphodiesterase [Clostridia bacterium]|nr:glycerophosphodiester phosphodiesterase [Clostridia bacterium]